jgi:hypothetical protein
MTYSVKINHAIPKEASMGSALERLGELTRQAESKTRAQRLGGETRQAAQRLEAAEARMRQADLRVQQVRPVRLRDLEKADADDALLREYIKKLAHSRGSLDAERQQEADRLIDTSREEISNLRRSAQAELEEIHREVEAARRELRAARDQYQSLRRELDLLLPDLVGEFVADDRLARDADRFFPAGQIQTLAREIDDGERHFGMLEQREQYAQLKIWIGRYRRLQAAVESGEAAELTEEEQAQLREIFPRLVGISKQYMPGYIEAFSRAFETDWDAYVQDATEQFHQATEAARAAREAEHRRREVQARLDEQRRAAREAGRGYLDELRNLIATHKLPEEGAEEFLNAVAKVVAHLGTADSQLLDLVRPYSELFGGKDFRALRRNLERGGDEGDDLETQREPYLDLLPATRDRHALIIGGDVREDRRRALEALFDFEELEWVPYESSRPAMLKSIEQRIRSGGMDLVLILKEFVGHAVSGSLRPLCEENDIPCLMVEHGYGAAQFAEALRRGLPRLVGGEA